MSRVKSSRLSRASQSSATCSSLTRRTLHRRRSCLSASSMANRLRDPGFRSLPALGSRPGAHAPPPHRASRDHAPASGHPVHWASLRPKAGPSRSLVSTSAVNSAPTAAHPIASPTPPSPPRSLAPPLRPALRCRCFTPPTGAAFKLCPITAPYRLRPASPDDASPQGLAPPRLLDQPSRPTQSLRPAPRPSFASQTLPQDTSRVPGLVVALLSCAHLLVLLSGS